MSEENDQELVNKMRVAHRMATRDSVVNEMLSNELRKAEASGELEQFRGQPLDLDDDPNWFLKRTLKQAGMGHPLLERSGDIDGQLSAAEEPLLRLRERRERLTLRQEPRDYERRYVFNEQRRRVLDEYRAALSEVNRAIQNYNLLVPSTLYRRPINIDATVEAAGEAIPPLPVLASQQAPEPVRKRGWRFWRRHR